MPTKSRPAAKVPAAGATSAPTNSAKPTMLGDLVVQPISIGTFWLLQEIDSPFLPGKGTPISMKDVAAAVYILTEGPGAYKALQAGRDEFDRQAFAAAARVPAADLASVATLLAGARTA